MYVVQITSEFARVAKVGGLADVLFGLSKALVQYGHTVEVILPKYDCLIFSELKELRVSFRELWCPEGGTLYNNLVWSAKIDGIHLVLIEPHHPKYYFSRGMIYGCHDDIDRFTYFSRAALEYLSKSGKRPDVVHVHDWPTSLIPVLYQELYADLPGHSWGTMLTIHNMEHQGKCNPSHLINMGLKAEPLMTTGKMRDPFSPHLANLLKGGIVYADRITTVSPNYARELQTKEGGFGLHNTLTAHADKFKGILNGIDSDYWNPGKDPHLITRFTTNNLSFDAQLDQVLAAKKENKHHLCVHCHLQENEKPLVVSVTRLASQKGPHLIKHAILRALECGAQFFLLGSPSSPALQKEFEELQQTLAGNSDVAILLDYNEALSHIAYAAADFFMIPSLFEPCGLAQMIALRYGAIPIARMTGGLVDTVFDIETSSKPEEMRNGFTFDFPDPEGVDWALERALRTFLKEPGKLRMLLRNGLRSDFSWEHSVPEYIALYQEITPQIDTVKVAL